MHLSLSLSNRGVGWLHHNTQRPVARTFAHRGAHLHFNVKVCVRVRVQKEATQRVERCMQAARRECAARSLQAGGLPGLRPGVQAGLQGADGWIGFVGWMVSFGWLVGWLDAPRSAGE
jgi:hypothetical protein